MNDISREELLKIAALSGLTLNEQEIAQFSSQLKTLLSYTKELANLDISNELEATRNVNVFREDKACKKPADDILAQAPELHDRYFVVPNILD